MRKYWIARAARVRFAVNLAWWLAVVGPALIAWALISAGLWIGLRWAEVGLVVRVGATLGGFMIAGIVAWFMAKPRFFGSIDALVLLDRQLGLEGALIAASERDVGWPAPLKGRSDGLRFRRGRALSLPPIAFGILLLAALIPISPRVAAKKREASMPPAWIAAEQSLEDLERADVFADPALETWKEELEKLQKSPPDEWYDDARLEAGDRLLEHIQGSAARAADGLEAAEAGLLGDPAAKDQQQRDWARAEEKLKGGTLQLDPELAKRLGEIDEKRLARMSPAEKQALRDKLEAGRAAAEKASGKGKGQGEGQGEGKEDPKGAGVARGPGVAPLELSGEERDLEAHPERVDSDDLRRAALGDPAGVSRHAHEPKTGEQLGVGGGQAGSVGSGGESVHRVAATPEEQAFLKRYFE